MTFVLIHGAWHGGWCWRFVRPLLGKHQVFAPSLTGLGERKHLAGPAVNLDTHIEDVVNLLEMEDLRDVVLVGHSYGGMVVTGAADRARSRIGIGRQQAGMALGDMKDDGARLEQREIAFLKGRNLPERMKRQMRGLLHRLERNETNLVRLAYFFQRPANARIARQSLAAVG